MTGPIWTIGGYHAAAVRIGLSDETLAFEAILLHGDDPVPVATVTNEGRGGAHLYRVRDADGWPRLRAFQSFASSWGIECDVRLEPDDALMSILVELALESPAMLRAADGRRHRTAFHVWLRATGQEPLPLDGLDGLHIQMQAAR